jgi:hypothetical protein
MDAPSSGPIVKGIVKVFSAQTLIYNKVLNTVIMQTVKSQVTELGISLSVISTSYIE